MLFSSENYRTIRRDWDGSDEGVVEGDRRFAARDLYGGDLTVKVRNGVEQSKEQDDTNENILPERVAIHGVSSSA